ncbi:MAG: hypothetical protein DA328_02345 [Nitrososphaeraceae archaeon]|nr:hypothetical protein [Nitrososphaeraceae archaeon]
MNSYNDTAYDIADDAITLDVKDNILNARNVMMKYNISRIIITDNKMLAGIVTEKDIVRFLYSSKLNRRPQEIMLDEVMGEKIPITVDEKTRLISCAKMMLSKNISSLIITQKNSADIRILTKTDIVEYYSRFYKRVNKVKDYMTTPVLSISQDELVSEAMRLLFENKVSRLVVIKNDKAIGIISRRDLIPLSSLMNSWIEKYQKNQVGFDTVIGNIKGIIIVKDVMRSYLITVSSNDDLSDAAKIMTRNRISGLPVVDKNSNLKGIVTKTDVVRAFSNLS